MEIIIAAFQRMLSGMQNGFGYAKNMKAVWIVAFVLMLYPLMVIKLHWLFFIFFIINIAIIILKTNSFTSSFKFLNKFKDIHLWENFVTGGFFLWMVLAGYNIILLCCSVYPALIIHKGLINIGSGLSFFDSATDDPTGKTYGIPLLGIKIKRASTTIRLIYAAISIVLATIVLLTGINFSLHW